MLKLEDTRNLAQDFEHDSSIGGAIISIPKRLDEKAAIRTPFGVETCPLVYLCHSLWETNLPQEPIKSAILDFSVQWKFDKTYKNYLKINRRSDWPAVWYLGVPYVPSYRVISTKKYNSKWQTKWPTRWFTNTCWPHNVISAEPYMIESNGW